jgi:hypothetical protein
MAIKYIIIFQSKALRNLPKLRFSVFEKKPSGNPAYVCTEYINWSNLLSVAAGIFGL